jgi:hypothetical protein
VGGAGAGEHRVVFYTAGANGVKCDIAVSVPGIGTHAYCVQRHDGKAVTGVSMGPSGSLSICHGADCSKNGLAPELAVGEKVGWPHSPFECTVRRTGVACIAAKTGTGFLIGANGVQQVLHL